MVTSLLPPNTAPFISQEEFRMEWNGIRKQAHVLEMKPSRVENWKMVLCTGMWGFGRGPRVFMCVYYKSYRFRTRPVADLPKSSLRIILFYFLLYAP